MTASVRACVALVVGLAGCLESGVGECPNGGVCPPGLTCIAVGAEDLCALPTCGDGVVDEGEDCDDGNHLANDACAADCRSDETCGNGIVDTTVGEQCDDGNLRSHDDCSSRCTIETPAWTSLAEAPVADDAHALVYDSIRGTLILFGGNPTLPHQLGETWEWDGARWRRRLTAVAPELRRLPAMAFDSDRGRVVMFGGDDRDDTWEWDGATWTQRTPATRPPPLADTAMVYDQARRRCVLFGGSTNQVPTAETWEWDGETWTRRMTAHTPPARAEHAMAYDAARGRTVMFGGFWFAPLGDTWELDGDDWSLRATSEPLARYRHSMAYDPARGVVVMTSGLHGEPTAEWNGTVWRSYPSTPSSMFLGADERITAAYDERLGRVVHFATSDPWPGPAPLRTTWLWDGRAWRTARDRADAVPPSRPGAVLTSTSEGVALIGPDAATWLWDGVTWRSATAHPPAPPPRTDAAVAGWSPTTGVDAVMLFGGRDETGAVLGDLWQGYLGMWQSIELPPTPRAGAALTAMGVNRALVFGGEDASGQLLADTWVLDGASFARRSPATRPSARKDALAAYDQARGRVVMFGGEDAAGPLVDVWEWDGLDWHARPAPPVAPATRRGLVYDVARARVVLVDQHLWDWDGTTWTDRGPASALPRGDARSAAYDPHRRRIVVLATSGARDEDVQAIEWTGSAWVTDPAEPGVPSARLGAAIALDRARNVVTMFGGADFWPPTEFRDPRPFADAWAWDGMRWTASRAAPAPERRLAPSFAFDDDRGESLLFGGYDYNTLHPPTWSWDGTRWQQLDDGRPAGRNYGAAVAYDAARREVVVYGGADVFTGGWTGDQFRWNGAWTSVLAPGPGVRAFSAMAYDRRRERLVLFGGFTGSHGLEASDVWEWDGAAWSDRTPAGGAVPPPRAHHALGWDERRQRVVLFGGQYQGRSLDDTWEWDGTAWTPLGAGAPGPRFDAALASDPRGGLVLFGGADRFEGRAAHVLRDTWFLRADDPAVPDEACLPGRDGDGDGLIGCDDPDCFCP